MFASKVLNTSAGRLRIVRPLIAVAVCAGLLAGCSDSPETMLASAKQYLAKNDLNAASIQLKNVLQKDGSMAEARFLLGTVNLDQDNVAGAVKELRRAAELGYPPVHVAPMLASALVRAGEFGQVIKEFEGTTLEDPAAQARLLAALGDAHLARADVDKARAAYEAAIAADPADTTARVGLGRAKLSRGDLDGALAEADAAIAQKSATADAHALRGDVLIVRRDTDEAVAALEAAVRERPAAINYHFALVSLLLRENRLDAAEQRLADMKKAAPAHPLTRYLQAFVDFRRDRFAEARDGVLEAIRVAPDYLPAQLLAGTIFVRLNDHPHAQQHLGLVLARAPGQPLARRLLVHSLVSSGEPNRALETLQPLLEESPTDKATMTLAGQVYLANGDFDRASEYLEKVALAEPEDVMARTRLGVSRLIGGDTTRAFADLEAASALDANSGQADIALILAHLRRGEVDQALAAQKQLEEKQPDDPQTYNLKGGILMAKKDVAGAQAAFEKALAVKPDFLAAAINLARLDLAARQPEGARKRLEHFITANPKNVDAHLVLADLLARSGAAPAQVLATLERAVGVSPSAMAPKIALARHHLGAKEPKKALAIAQEVATANPNDPVAVGSLARIQFAAGDREQAISSFNRLAGLQPKSPAPLIALSDVQRAAGDRTGAEHALRRALALKPDLLEAQQRMISLMVEHKRVSDAVAVARTVTEQRPDSPAGLVLEGDIHMAVGDPSQAVPLFRKALDRTPAGAVAVKLYSAQTRAGKRADAEKLAATWLRNHPKDLVMRGYLAEGALRDKRLDEADKLYRQMDQLSPDNALVLNNLAWVAGQRKDPQALALAKRALALAPENPAVLDTLGMLQIESGAREEGLANLRKAVSLAPNAGTLRLNLVRGYVRTERKEEARKELDTLLKQVVDGSPLHAEAIALKQGL